MLEVLVPVGEDEKGIGEKGEAEEGEVWVVLQGEHVAYQAERAGDAAILKIQVAVRVRERDEKEAEGEKKKTEIEILVLLLRAEGVHLVKVEAQQEAYQWSDEVDYGVEAVEPQGYDGYENVHAITFWNSFLVI